MFKESSTRTLGRNSSRNPQFEANENVFEASQNIHNYPPPRTPLNTIPDPCQYQKEPQEYDANSHYKIEAIRSGRSSDRFVNLSLNNGTPRGLGRYGKESSEPNSAQSTPARSASRISLGGAGGICPGTRVQYSGGGKTGSSGTFFKGISVANSEFSKEVQHFELKEDPSFWMDHNVQVLIRIRPLNNIEKFSQGYDRCLRQESAQTLVWVGHPETRFTFDHIACETLSQENLFRVAGVPMVENCFSGYNSCIFAYGQTGSGKTYTMMGEIKEEEGHLTEDSGITLRVFDYLFMRIKLEEESRRDDKLRYSCRCSFLEIYNEQITDLLEPSSTNLQLREDTKKGVYVENLSEHSVGTVSDVLKLLLQGTANRKVAATHMNSNSSRSHSVFTCIIESRWEKNTMTHLRFARLNLVDLAGSERQKSSGTDSERLKEAANINKSLSTLGLVIMNLVDLTHGKPRHVPYRDSRLTFLLQDSLGGNSKTMIISNVSPSICSSNETLSTLKFAQRAKLIQNNVKVNEGTSGDINALQWQIQQLKSQLSFLIKQNNFPSPVSNLEPYPELCRLSESSEGFNSFMENATMGQKLCLQTKEIKCMKAALLGALRREKVAEIKIQDLHAEIERLNCLARQREVDAQHTAFKLRLCEEKINQLEVLVDGALSPEEYLLKENRALKNEIKELQSTIENNPQTTRLALENDRILHELQQFQNFYEHGERERLMTELSQLRDQLVVSLQEKFAFPMRNENQDDDTKQELEDCQIMNSKLLRDVERLQTELVKYISCDRAKSDSVLNSSFELPNELMKTDKCSLVDTIYLKSDAGDEMPFNTWTVDDLEGHALGASDVLTKENEDNRQKMLEAKLEKMSKDLEEVKLLNDQYQEKWALKLSQKNQIESVCEEVEMETTRTILHLQEEIAGLQSDLEGRLCSIAQENTELRNMVATKEEEIRTLCMEWERAIFELTNFLLDGSRSLRDACGQVESITGSLPEGNTRIAEHIGMAVKSYMEKDETIQKLESSLEDAQKMVWDMELKVGSLKEATATLTAFQPGHNEDSVHLRMLLDEKTNMLRLLENEVKYKDDQLRKAEKRADAAFLLVRWLSDSQNVVAGDISNPGQDVHSKLDSRTTFEDQGDRTHLISNELMAQVELTIPEVLEMDAAADAFCEDREIHMAHFQTSTSSLSPADTDLVLNPVKQNQDPRTIIKDLKMQNKSSACCAADSLIADTEKCLKLEEWHHILHQIQKELVDMNIKLSIIENYINTEMYLSNCSLIDNDLMDFDASSADSSSVSDSSTDTESIVSGNILHGSRSTCRVKFPGKITEQIVNPKSEGGFAIQADNQKSENTDYQERNSIQREAAASFLRNELYATYEAFNKQNAHFSELLKELDNGSCSCVKEQGKEALCELMIQKFEAGNQNDPKVFGDMTTRLDDSLTKFEEAHATVKEADFMLHALTKAYEDAKLLSVTRKQTNENLMIERASLADEIQKLKSSICHKEEENQLLKDHINYSLIEMENSVSMLEECFLQVQTDVEKKFMSIFSYVLLIQKEMICFTTGLRTSLEDIFSWVMGERFASFVLNNCYVTELVSKFLFFRVNHNFPSTKQEEVCKFLKVCSNGESVLPTSNEGSGKRDQRVEAQILQEEQDLPNSNLMYEHMALRKELERKEELLEGLFFDLRLLQELASNGKDIKEETEKLITSLSQVRYELDIKTNYLEDTLVQNRKLEGSLAETERALSTSNHELKLAQELIGKLSDHNAEFREIMKELYSKKVEADEQLNEQKDVIKGLEKEIVNLTSSLENSSLSLLEGIEDELRKVIIERDQLHEEVSILNDKLEMANSLADEKEAIAIEARQESETCKLYTEQKEEEVKILEHSVEELEGTINVLEKKVYEMDEEVGRHHLIRDSLEKKLLALEERLQAFDSIPQNADSDITEVQHEEQTSRQPSRRITDLHEALNRIRILEEEKAEQDKQIKQCKEYISEVVLHAEAQASRYQQKYKSLESMFREVKKEMSNLTSTAPSEKGEKSSMRARGSSSPFRCISNLVHQMNQEKDQELSAAKLRVEELEALAASRQKEVCLLQTRLAATESMTHDVIRDLLGVKMDITNYATLVDQNQILKLVEEAHNLREELFAKEKEVHNQSLLINELIEERESCKSELRSKDADTIASQIAVQRLQERNQLLLAQREMLKKDKTNLMKKVAELDDMVKTLSATRENQPVQQTSKIKDRSSEKLASAEITRRLSQYERLLSRENDKLAKYCKSFANKHTARPPT